MPHVAKRAAAGAFVTHNHESGRAFAKALADVGAIGLFAHGVQFVLTQNLLNFRKSRVAAARFHANPVGLFEHLVTLNRDDFDGDAGGFGLCGLLAGCVVGGSVSSVHKTDFKAWARFMRLKRCTASRASSHGLQGIRRV